MKQFFYTNILSSGIHFHNHYIFQIFQLVYKLKSFEYDELDLAYMQTDHLIGLAEVLLLDTYRADLLKSGSTVVDLGAGIGDFAVLASKKVGPQGKVIALEPNADDFELLESNLRRNGCRNVIALNLGVAERPGQKEISFWGRKYAFNCDTLENVLARLKVSRIDFVKMDIEGFETAVIGNSIETIRQADAISIELHGTKDEIDRILGPRGFVFRPVPWWRAGMKFISSLAAHPGASLRALFFTIRAYPQIMMGIGEALRKERFTTGVYVRSAGRAVVIQ
jgi:FkbM family methyltransferase